MFLSGSSGIQPISSLILSDYARREENEDSEPDPHFSTPPASADVAHVLLIASVCRRWRELAHESVTTLRVLRDRLVSREYLKRVLVSFPNLTRLHLSNGSMETIDDDFLAFLGSSSPNLTALYVGTGIAPYDDLDRDEEKDIDEFGELNHPVTTAGLDILFRHCRRLEQLSLQCLHWTTKLPASFFLLTRLHTLSLGGISPLVDPNFANLSSITRLSIQKLDMRLHQMSPLTRLPNLTSLFFPGATFFHSFEGDFSFNQLTNLCSLGFVRGSTDFPSMFPPESPCFRLQRLLLSDIPSIPSEELEERFPVLRELCLSGSSIFTEIIVPDSLTSLSTLEVLTIFNCRISSLPENFGDFPGLKSLRLRSLSLKRLPDSIGLLTGLQKLSLHHVSIDILPAAISCLAALESLSIAGTRLTAIPEEIGELINLRDLVLSWCAELQQLPASFSRLSSLTRLDISTCPIGNIPESIGRLGDLRELTLSCCNELTALPASITQLSRLKTFKACMCIKLASAPRAMGSLSCMRELDLTGCVLLQETLESLPRSLETLSLGNDTSSIILPDLSTTSNLRKLNLGQVIIMDAPATSRCLSQIEHLDMRLGSEQTELPLLLGFLSRLRDLHISNALSLQHLPRDIGSALPRLRQLHVEGAETLTEIPESVTRLVQLTSLLIEAPRLTHLPDTISSVSRLGDLCLRNCSSLTSLPSSFTNLTYLHKLDVSKTALHSLPPNFHHLARLRYLDLSDCEQLEFPPQQLCSLTLLRVLDLQGCKKLGQDPMPFDLYIKLGLKSYQDESW